MNIIRIVCDTPPFVNELPITEKTSVLFTVIQYVLGIAGLVLIVFAIYGIIAGILGMARKKNEKKDVFLLVAGVISLVVGLPIVFALYAILFTVKNNFL